jgi:hypothetical protein
VQQGEVAAVRPVGWGKGEEGEEGTWLEAQLQCPFGVTFPHNVFLCLSMQAAPHGAG